MSAYSQQYTARRNIRREITRRTVRTLLRIAVVLIIFMCVIVLLTAEPFQVKSVRIAGVHTLSQKQVESLASSLIGQNIFRARTGAVRDQLLSIPEIKGGRIRRTPRMTAVVTVEQRKPFIALAGIKSRASEDGKDVSLPNPQGFTIIDAEGVAFRRVAQPPPDVIRAYDAQLRSPRVGQSLPLERFVDLRRCVEYVTDAHLPKPSEMRRDRYGSIVLMFHDGLMLKIGRDLWKEKLLLAHKTLEYIRHQGKVAESIDLRSLEAAVWKPKEGKKDVPAAGVPVPGTS